MQLRSSRLVNGIDDGSILNGVEQQVHELFLAGPPAPRSPFSRVVQASVEVIDLEHDDAPS